MAEIGQARVKIDATGMSRERAERIARLVFYHLHAALSSGHLDFGPPRTVAHMSVPALEVNTAEMDDDAIARRGAAWIYRWMRNAE